MEDDRLWEPREGKVIGMSNLSGTEQIQVRKERSTCGGMGWLGVGESAGPARLCEACQGTRFAEPEWVPFAQFLADFIELLTEQSAHDLNPSESE